MRRGPWTPWSRVTAVVALAAAVSAACGSSGAARPAGGLGSPETNVSTSSITPAATVPRAKDSPWTVYHGDPLGSGEDPAGVTFSPPAPAWRSPTLDGEVYGEPLEATGRVFVATENDSVYALAANTGAVLWRAHVGTPVPSGSLPCGDISPVVGITGTPVIDEKRGEIFAVAAELVGGLVTHQLVGLNIYTGAVVLDQSVDPPGTRPSAQLQRTGLNLSGGAVVFGLGGNYGDCSTYHGFVIGVPEGGGQALTYELDRAPGQLEGAVWMGGAAPEVDGSGDIWFSAGNGSATSPSTYDGSDSVIELSPQLTLLQLFAPANWYTGNRTDGDLGSTAPAITSGGAVLQVGKTRTGYLLEESKLGGVGGQIDSAPVCAGSDAAGGDAVSGNAVYVPCLSGIEKVVTSVSPPALQVSWTAASGAAGPPIVAGGLVWSIGGGALYGIDPGTGATRQKVTIGADANHFPTPSVGDGLLLVPGYDQVIALSGSAGVPGPPSPPGA